MQTSSKSEARTLAEESLSILRQLPAGREMIYALQLLGALTQDDDEKRTIAEECLTIARTIQAGWWLPVCMIDLSQLAINRGDYAEAKALLEEVLRLARDDNNQSGLVQSANALSQIALLEGRYAAAKSLAQMALKAAEDMGFAAALWWSHSAVADSALFEGDYAAAHAHYRQGAAISQGVNDRLGVMFELCGLACAASSLNEHAQAQQHCCEALRIAAELGEVPALLEVVSAVAWFLAERGEPERAVQLVVSVTDHPRLERITRARNHYLLQTLGSTPPAETILKASGQTGCLDLDEIIPTLLAEFQQPVGEFHPPEDIRQLADPLTERESEVLQLIDGGMSNDEIAVRLFLGVSTVKTHINHIFSKLGVKNRTQAAARARELRLI